MNKIFAGAILLIVILFGAGSSSVTVYAAATEQQSVLTVETDEVVEADESNENEEAQVLGEKREPTDKFILVIEIAISLTFAVGLIAASHGSEVK